MKERIIKQITDEIKNLKQGEEFWIADYLKKHQVKKDEKFEYYSLIISEIKI